MSLAPISAWEAAAAMFEAPVRRWATPGQMAQALDSTTIQTPALDLIDGALVDVADGRNDRLILTCPPQEGKSERASRRFPLWLLANNPDLRIAIVSYSDEMARRWGSDIKRDLEDNPDLGLVLRADSKAAGRWQIEGKKGGVYCVGIAGSLTGKPVDCVRGDTKILTEYGYARIDDIHRRGAPYPRVLGFDHNTGQATWRDVVASRAIADRPLVEVITESGRRIVCTPDHRVFTSDRGYVPADQLRPGQGLVAADAGTSEVQRLRDGVPQGAVGAVARDAGDPAVLLEGVPVRPSLGEAAMPGVRLDVQEASLRRGQGRETGPDQEFLQESLLVSDDWPRSAGASGRATDGGTEDGPASSGDRRSDSHGHRPPQVLQPGNRRTVGRQEPVPGLRSLRCGSQGHGGAVPELLAEGTGRDVPDSALRALRRRVHKAAGRVRQGAAQWAKELLLLARLLKRSTQGRGVPLPEVRSADRVEGPRPTVLLEGLPTRGQQGRQGAGLPAVRSRVLPEEHQDGLLRPDLRKRRALGSDGRCGELALQGRYELRGLVPQNATAGDRQGRPDLPCLRDGRPDGPDGARRRVPVQVAAGGPSPQRVAVGQPAGEPDHVVPAVPHGAPQVSGDTVSVVRELRGTRDVVYDLQVDGTSNFFAEEVLVHNCLIIDDPIKDLEQARSSVYRERAWRFWQAVAVPRLGPGAKAVLIQTRWHEDDLAGRLIGHDGTKDTGGRWKLVSIPAEADTDEDPLGRQPGEFMVSARGDRDWASIKKSVGAYVWSSLYQQHPAPAEGGLFKRLWWRYWSMAPAGMDTERIDLGGRVFPLSVCWRFITGDLAASTRTSADYTVAAAWALTSDGDLILLDRVKAKVGEANHFDLFRPLAERWRVDTAFIEKSFISSTLAIDATHGGLHVTPIDPEGDKFSRALPYSARVSSGRVWLPAGASWTGDWVDEHSAFPNGSHDDQVDVGSYATRVAVTRWSPVPFQSQPHPTTKTSPGFLDDGPAVDFATANF